MIVYNQIKENIFWVIKRIELKLINKSLDNLIKKYQNFRYV